MEEKLADRRQTLSSWGKVILGIPFLLFLLLAMPFGALFGDETIIDKPATRVVPEVKATRLNPHAPRIDGKLDDPIWQSDGIEIARGFTQMEPREGEAPTESTLVAFVYDDDALYVACWNYDSEPDEIIRQLVRRDRWAESDQIAIMLDPYHDHRTGCKFQLNASGVQRDRRIWDDSNTDDAWDAVWESAVAKQPWGWSAEMKIPYHCLRFANKEEHTWGLNVERYISRKQETSWWAFSPSTEGGYASRFGHLTHISGITPSRHLEVLPYSVTRLQTEPTSPGNPDGREFLGDAGFDVKYGISSNLILDATINPDFGQVELDQPVLNLSAFETWFDEKRPFFLEGSDIFQTNFTLFYSRRIGHAPSLWFDDADYYTDRPDATTILTAAKLTGKIADRTAIGILNAYTNEETADYIDGDGEHRSAVVEPRANYSILRIKQDILRSSHVGVIGTLASQDTEYPASTGGFDWDLSTNDARWSFDGQIVASRVNTGGNGYGFNGSINKEAGKHIRGEIGATIKDRQFDIHHLGFTPRNDIREGWVWMQYRTQEPWKIFRHTYHNINGYLAYNYNGDNITKGWNYNTYLEFTNGWSLGGGFNQDVEEYDDYETRGSGLWKVPKAWGWWANLETDPRKMVSVNLNPGSGHSRNGTWWAHYTGISIKPRTNIEIDVGVNYLRYFGNTRWVDNEEDPVTGENIPIFADLDQDKVTPGFAASIALTTRLSWQISAQMLLSGLDYSNCRLYLGGEEYADLGDTELDEEYDFNQVALNSTMILRWEYLPGSTLYFVWTRSQFERSHYNDLSLSRDIDTAFSSDADNVWLVKVSYWWNI